MDSKRYMVLIDKSGGSYYGPIVFVGRGEQGNMIAEFDDFEKAEAFVETARNWVISPGRLRVFDRSASAIVLEVKP
jgi:hypothetical protein